MANYSVDNMRYPTIDIPNDFDSQKPFGKAAGDNKFGLRQCPFCDSYGHALDDGAEIPKMVFTFKDRLSAREYEISGLCQNCQDGTFKG